VSIRVHVDVSDWLDALDAHEGPQAETRAALGAVLSAVFAETQESVHVITGSLKASGRMKTDVDGAEWEGVITYGGPAPGMPHPIVTYAADEFNRGHDHHPMANMDLTSYDFAEAMTATVRARLL
jgi:hypothetical protein